MTYFFELITNIIHNITLKPSQYYKTRAFFPFIYFPYLFKNSISGEVHISVKFSQLLLTTHISISTCSYLVIFQTKHFTYQTPTTCNNCAYPADISPTAPTHPSPETILQSQQ